MDCLNQWSIPRGKLMPLLKWIEETPMKEPAVYETWRFHRMEKIQIWPITLNASLGWKKYTQLSTQTSKNLLLKCQEQLQVQLCCTYFWGNTPLIQYYKWQGILLDFLVKNIPDFKCGFRTAGEQTRFLKQIFYWCFDSQLFLYLDCCRH